MDLPVKPLPDDAVDIAAKEVAAQVVLHIKMMYPCAAAAVSMESMSRSLSGVIRNNMSRIGKAAESGEIISEIKKMKGERSRLLALHRKSRS